MIVGYDSEFTQPSLYDDMIVMVTLIHAGCVNECNGVMQGNRLRPFLLVYNTCIVSGIVRR